MTDDRDVKRPIMAVAVPFSDRIPDPRDAAAVGLADTAGMLRGLLSPRKLDYVAPRIECAAGPARPGRLASGMEWRRYDFHTDLRNSDHSSAAILGERP